MTERKLCEKCSHLPHDGTRCFQGINSVGTKEKHRVVDCGCTYKGPFKVHYCQYCGKATNVGPYRHDPELSHPKVYYPGLGTPSASQFREIAELEARQKDAMGIQPRFGEDTKSE